ncbi:hypothetical protein [Zoogloea sp.]|uniref:hypothetical protein n=1 Tax=Zoogloea sp. TaxID=49181 RepID=UPI0035B15559
MKLNRLTLLALWAAIVASPLVAGVVGGGYIAGDGFSLAQALADAKREHRAGSGDVFWLLVKGAEIQRLTSGADEAGLAADLAEVQRRGGVIFVCRQDLSAAQLTAGDLIPGVQVVRGWDAAESGVPGGEADGRDAPLAPLRSIDRLCAQGAAPDGE